MRKRFANAAGLRVFLLCGVLAVVAGCGQESTAGNDNVSPDKRPAGEASQQETGQQPSSTATLSWLPPTENEDGSALEDLAGYRIYSGPTEEDLTLRETVDNPGLSSYVLESLEPDEIFFAMTAVNLQGAESSLSEVAERAPAG